MKTVRVRIAMTVDPDGGWRSAGWKESGYGDEERDMRDCVEENADDMAKFYWIEADVPIPEAESVIQGEVIMMCPNCVTPWKCNGPHDAR